MTKIAGGGGLKPSKKGSKSSGGDLSIPRKGRIQRYREKIGKETQRNTPAEEERGSLPLCLTP